MLPFHLVISFEFRLDGCDGGDEADYDQIDGVRSDKYERGMYETFY